MADMTRKGYGQVEPNHLSAQYTGQIYAQLPAKDSSNVAIATLENGQFLRYNYPDGRASIDGEGEWMLVYNEEKLYDATKQGHKDFVLKATDQTDGLIYPRLLKTNVGDIYTTNAFRTSGGLTVTGPDATITMPELAVGDYLTVTNGWLVESQSLPEGIAFQVVKVYTLPDGQDAVKIMRIQ